MEYRSVEKYRASALACDSDATPPFFFSGIYKRDPQMNLEARCAGL